MWYNITIYFNIIYKINTTLYILLYSDLNLNYSSICFSFLLMFGTMGTLSAMDYGIFFMSHSGSSVEHSLSTEKSCNELKSATFETERILGKMNIHTTNFNIKVSTKWGFMGGNVSALMQHFLRKNKLWIKSLCLSISSRISCELTFRISNGWWYQWTAEITCVPRIRKGMEISISGGLTVQIGTGCLYCSSSRICHNQAVPMAIPKCSSGQWCVKASIGSNGEHAAFTSYVIDELVDSSASPSWHWWIFAICQDIHASTKQCLANETKHL